MKEGKAASRSRRKVFLALLELGVSVNGAARAAGLDRTAVYKFRKCNAAFAAAWDAAIESGNATIEDEILRRGVFGFPRPVFHAGKQVGTITQYSDKMLALLARMRRPEKFRPLSPARERDPEDTSVLIQRLEAARRRIAEDKPAPGPEE
jgi:hypothetical protein